MPHPSLPDERRRSITLTAMERLPLFRQTLEMLAANCLEGWRVFVRIEPTSSSADFVNAVEEILAGCDFSVLVNDTRLGVRLNPYRAIEAAFEWGSQLNLHLEEDFSLSPDATEMALWYAEHHQPHWLVLSLLAGPCASAGLLSNPNFPGLLFEGRTFNSLGFAVRHQEWQSHIRGAWLGEDTRLEGYAAMRQTWGWDWAVYALLASSRQLRSVQPVLARANHTGRVGTHSTERFHDQAFGQLQINTAANVDYQLAEVSELPHLLASHIQQMDERTDLILQLEKLSLFSQSSLSSIAWARVKSVYYRLKVKILSY